MSHGKLLASLTYKESSLHEIWCVSCVLVMVQEDYHSQNPYHNAVHAADVTQAMYCYLKEPKVKPKIPCFFCVF